MIQIEPIDANDQVIEADLDGSVYHLGLSWNEEAQRWTFSVRDLDQIVIVSGLPLVPLFPLLRQVRTPLLPPGEFMADCPRGAIGRNSFKNGDASLFYIPFDELP